MREPDLIIRRPNDPPSDIAQQEFVAVPYRAQELVLEPSHEGEDIDAHESWFEIESTRSIARLNEAVALGRP